MSNKQGASSESCPDHLAKPYRILQMEMQGKASKVTSLAIGTGKVQLEGRINAWRTIGIIGSKGRNALVPLAATPVALLLSPVSLVLALQLVALRNERKAKTKRE